MVSARVNPRRSVSMWLAINHMIGSKPAPGSVSAVAPPQARLRRRLRSYGDGGAAGAVQRKGLLERLSEKLSVVTYMV